MTSIGLALLLLVGIAMAGHFEGEESAPVAAAVSTTVAPSHSVDNAPVSAAVEGVLESDVLVGTALCLLGVLCGLALFALVRILWHRRPQPAPVATAPLQRPVPMLLALPRVVSFTPTELGISRT
ncbi:hypothetical protein [Microbacterium sp.]|uniref:hypothetical protein n=1 Tax=Microbacterium sp. TaxID=51671 RepID=UPI003F6F8030